MMLAMALAHRQRATRAGGGWCREGSAQPPGLCTLLAAIALFLVLVGSATLGVERAVAAVENTRSDKLPAYNSAAMSWRLGGSAVFANESRGLELRVNGAPTPLVPRNGTSSEAAVPAEIADTRDDVARVRRTHVLCASIPRANTRDSRSHGSINGSILVPPGVLVTFSVGRGSTTKVAVGPAGGDGPRASRSRRSRARAWSHSRVSARDRVDCDACATWARRASVDASARCAAACDAPGTGRRFVARRALGRRRRARRGGGRRRPRRRRRPSATRLFLLRFRCLCAAPRTRGARCGTTRTCSRARSGTRRRRCARSARRPRDAARRVWRRTGTTKSTKTKTKTRAFRWR